MLIVRFNFAQFCTEVESKEQGTRKDKEQGTESLPHNIKEEEQEGGGRTDYNFLLRFRNFEVEELPALLHPSGRTSEQAGK
jgi:hypothetical protein